MFRAYIIGISGKATSALAKMFVDLGWEVEGSDQNCYPPASTYLDEMGVKYRTPYAADNLVGHFDLVVIGGNALIVDKNNPEVEKAKSLGMKAISYPEVLEEFVVKKNSIVPVGTYGKTTSTAVLAWVLSQNGFDPSFMIGAQPLNFESGIHLGTSPYSVIEGDEHPTLGYSPLPKFAWYQPTHVLFTAATWDHINVYPTLDSYKKVFEDLVSSLGADRLLVACLDGEFVPEIIKEAQCRTITYSTKDSTADYFVADIRYDEDFTRFRVKNEEIESPLLGEHNIQNVLGCLVICHELGMSTADFSNALRGFKGINRRLEIRGVFGGVTIIDDHAHSPVKAQASLKALRTRYRGKIIAVFDPSFGALRERESLAWYPGMFDEASEVIVAKVPRHKGVTGGERVLGPDIVTAIQSTQPNVIYQPVDEEIVNHTVRNTQPGDVIVFMSSGSWRGIIEKTEEQLNR